MDSGGVSGRPRVECNALAGHLKSQVALLSQRAMNAWVFDQNPVYCTGSDSAHMGLNAKSTGNFAAGDLLIHLVRPSLEQMLCNIKEEQERTSLMDPVRVRLLEEYDRRVINSTID